ncbi:hypothetical protein GAY28_01615 [Azospirillum brasilense]|nr:hypothetical protein [Azospirillum brasilense]
MDDAIAYIIAALLLQIPAWVIPKKAGFHPALSLVNLIPGLGILVLSLILAFSTWPAGEA